MKIALNVVGLLLAAAGLLWTLQGANLVRGSFMSGSLFWLIVGIVCLLAGAGMIFVANRGSESSPPQ